MTAYTKGLAIAAALPFAAAMVGGPSAGADPLPPDPPPFGEIFTGSANPDSGASGSADQDALATGSAGTELALAPPVPRYRPGSGSAGLALPPPELGPTATQPPLEGSVELPDPDSETVQQACAGSVAVGSALILLGIVTGSGPGSSAYSSSGSAFGSGITGSGLGSSVFGSSGSALGSAAVGSGLACLLWPRDMPPWPGLQLLLAPPTPAVSGPQAQAAVVQEATIVRAAPDAPLAQKFRPPQQLESLELSTDPVAWNLLQLMTIVVVAILTTVRAATIRHRRQ